MAKNASSELLDRLKTSLPKPTASLPPTPPPPAPQITPPPPLTAAVQKPDEPPPVRRPNAPKLSVSLYPTDLRRLDEIKAFMQHHGFRNLSDSEALRLACRGVVIDERFLELYRAMQVEDGRRKSAKT